MPGGPIRQTLAASSIQASWARCSDQRPFGAGLGGEVEVLERLGGREAGGADALAGAGGLAREHLGLAERLQELLVGPALGAGALGRRLQPLEDPRRLQRPQQVGQPLAAGRAPVMRRARRSRPARAARPSRRRARIGAAAAGGSGRIRGGGNHCPRLVAAPVAGNGLAAVDDPDLVAIEAQLDALMDQRQRRPVEVAAQLEVAVQRDADRPRPGEVERGRRQRPQHLALVREPLGDREAAGGMDAPVADLVAPARVVLVELAQAAEPPRRPEPRLQMADAALDRALLARRRRRAGRGVERVVAAQREEPLVPGDLVAVAARDRRAQVVIDALADHAAQPVEDPDVALQEALGRQIEAEVRRLRARVGQRRDQRVDAPLAPGDPRPRRHLGPVELQHLPRPIARPLRRPHRPRSQPSPAACGPDRPSRRSRSPRAGSPSPAAP